LNNEERENRRIDCLGENRAINPGGSAGEKGTDYELQEDIRSGEECWSRPPSRTLKKGGFAKIRKGGKGGLVSPWKKEKTGTLMALGKQRPATRKRFLAD